MIKSFALLFSFGRQKKKRINILYTLPNFKPKSKMISNVAPKWLNAMDLLTPKWVQHGSKPIT